MGGPKTMMVAARGLEDEEGGGGLDKQEKEISA